MAKIERTKNATRNVIYGFILKAYTLFVPFLMRTAVIYFLGIQYLGLSSLFSSVLQVLNLAELGVGSAMVFSMYKPIAEDDTVTICALMKLYKIYYRIIGVIIASLGILLTPFIPKLISGAIPDAINIYILYYLNLGATVLSYWLFAYKNSILMAHQRTDIASKVTLATTTFQYIFQIGVLWYFRNYYYYVIITLVTQVLTNIMTAIYANKLYPNYKPIGKLEKNDVKEINQRIKDLFTAKLGTVLGTSVNSIVISANLGLSVLAVFHNYYCIINAIIGFIQIIFTSIRAGIGNSLIIDNAEKNYNDFNKLVFMILWIVTVSAACFATTCQPFMQLWVGKRLLLPNYMVGLFCIMLFLMVIQNLSCAYKDAAGIWHEDRFRPLVTVVVNLILNIIFVRLWGLQGVIIAMIFSYLFIAMPWVVHNLFKFVFKRKANVYILKIVKGFFLFCIIISLCHIACTYIFISTNGLLRLIVNFVISICFSNMLLTVFNKNDVVFYQVINLLKRITSISKI